MWKYLNVTKVTCDKSDKVTKKTFMFTNHKYGV